MAKRNHNPAKFDRCVKKVKAKGGSVNAYAVCTAAGTRKSKKNPEDTAAALYESFHGAASKEIAEFVESEHYHGHLAELGICCGVCVVTLSGMEAAIGMSGCEWDKREGGFVPGAEVQSNPLFRSFGRYEERGGPKVEQKGRFGKRTTSYRVQGRIPKHQSASGSTSSSSSSDLLDGLAKSLTGSSYAKLSAKDQATVRAAAARTRAKNKRKGPIASALGFAGDLGSSVDQGIGKAIGFKGNPASWVIVDKKTGKAVMETFKKKTADAVNKDRYKVMPIDEYLQELNAGIKRKGNPDPVSTSTVLLCSNESGNQLFFIGGDQSLDLDSLSMSGNWERDSMVIGRCEFIAYLTAKEFDKFEPTVYEHELGEESGECPTLRYDRLSSGYTSMVDSIRLSSHCWV